MAASHARSISFPSRSTNPNSLKIEDELSKLKTWQTSIVSTTASITVETIQVGLVGLAKFYTYVEELLHSPLTRQTLIRHQQVTFVEQALDRSIMLLDSCGTIRDLILVMRDHVHELQSALRRKSGEISSESRSISTFICFRKKVKKDAAKSLRNLKKMESGMGSLSLFDLDENLSTVVRVLGEITSIAISIFNSLLIFLSMPTPKPKADHHGWSLISKLMLSRSASFKRGKRLRNEIESVDLAISHLQGRNGGVKVDVQLVRERLQTLDESVECLEDGLNCLFRRLIQNRASLLNILIH